PRPIREAGGRPAAPNGRALKGGRKGLRVDQRSATSGNGSSPRAAAPRKAAHAPRKAAHAPRAAAPRTAQDRLKYVYCIIPEGRPLTFGPLGLGPEPGDVHTVSYRDLAAVVSDTPMGVH